MCGSGERMQLNDPFHRVDGTGFKSELECLPLRHGIPVSALLMSLSSQSFHGPVCAVCTKRFTSCSVSRAEGPACGQLTGAVMIPFPGVWFGRETFVGP